MKRMFLFRKENINGAFQGDEVEFLITKSPEEQTKRKGKIVWYLMERQK